MKVALVLLVPCLFLIGHSEKQQSKGYEIIGNVKNLPAKWVFMRIGKRRPKDNQPYWPKVDSARVVDGKFILNKDTVLLDPAWASSIAYIDTNTNKAISLKFLNPLNSKLYPNFILENAKILIEGDANIKTGLSIIGSKETDFFFKHGLIFPTYNYELRPKIDSLKKIGDLVALTEVLKREKELAAKFKADMKALIIDNPSTHQSLVNLYQNSKEFTPAELEELIKLFDPALLKTEYGAKLRYSIQQQKLILTSKTFPSFSYYDHLQKKVSLTDVKGENGTLIVFWASWCVPCRREIPDLKKLYAQYHAKGINIVGISIDHDIVNWKQALTKENMPWTNLSNLPGDYKEISKKFNVTSIPSIFLLDKNNKIVLADVDFPGVEAQVKLLIND